MSEAEVYKKENQRVSASEVLQSIAGGMEIKLSGCTISGSLDINRLFVKDENFDTKKVVTRTEDSKTVVTLAQLVSFNRCTFEGDVCFSSPWEKPGELEVVFKRDVVFNSSAFCGQTRFSGSIFRGLAGFDGCTFERVAAFREVYFHSRSMFRTVYFNGYALLGGSIFRKEARFTNSCFGKGGNFSGIVFEEAADFSGVHSQSKSVPIYDSVKFCRSSFGDGESFWRFIKQACQEAGHYHHAGEAFYNERCTHFWRQLRGTDYSSLSSFGKFFRLLKGVRLVPEFVFGRLLFGFGERPTRILLASAFIILACGLFYSNGDLAEVVQRGAPANVEMSFLDGLYLSTTTFTTLGPGDIYPDREHGLTRVVFIFEAISGAFLMALFVVALAKRFSRG
ncbi:MAG: potassium channel family protein [Planctomycetes bacterium]|nr:potassium channel family protein [Planctomycetota bacterium]